MRKTYIASAGFRITGMLALLICLLPGMGQASDYYIGQHSKGTLEQICNAEPDNYSAAYYLGMIHLQDGNTAGALAQWDRCLKTAPDSAKTQALKERIMVLKMQQVREAARASARERINQGLSKKPEGIRDSTVAVMNFRLSGLSGKEAVGKGLSAMIITDLSQVPGLTVVEREKIQALQEELRLAMTGIVNPKQASLVGELAMAGRIVDGSLAGSDDLTDIDITSAVVHTLRGESLGENHAAGNMEQFFAMEKELVSGILETLGISLDRLPGDVVAAINKIHTRDEDAFLSYSLGLDAQDKGRWEAARRHFQDAVQADPDFGMAREALADRPDEIAFEYIENPEYFDYSARDVREAEPSISKQNAAAPTATEWVMPTEMDPVEEIPPQEEDTDIIGPVPELPMTP